MLGTFYDIGAAVPFRRLVSIGLEFARCKIELVPTNHSLALIERERQLVRMYLVVGGFQGIQIRADLNYVLARHFRVIGVGHRRIEMDAAVPDAIAHGVDELAVGPAADPSR